MNIDNLRQWEYYVEDINYNIQRIDVEKAYTILWKLQYDVAHLFGRDIKNIDKYYIRLATGKMSIIDLQMLKPELFKYLYTEIKGKYNQIHPRVTWTPWSNT